jgi:hypothetical protein
MSAIVQNLMNFGGTTHESDLTLLPEVYSISGSISPVLHFLSSKARSSLYEYTSIPSFPGRLQGLDRDSTFLVVQFSPRREQYHRFWFHTSLFCHFDLSVNLGMYVFFDKSFPEIVHNCRSVHTENACGNSWCLHTDHVEYLLKLGLITDGWASRDVGPWDHLTKRSSGGC